FLKAMDGIEPDVKSYSNLMKKITTIKKESIPDTHIEHSKMYKNISAIIDNVAFLFHFITADKLEELVDQKLKNDQIAEETRVLNDIHENPELRDFYLDPNNIS